MRRRWWRFKHRVRWAIGRRVLREELEAFGDANYASIEAKVGGDLALARAILTNGKTTDQLPGVFFDVDYLTNVAGKEGSAT